MISKSPITTIIPVDDMSRATTFYRDTLGLTDLGDSMAGNHALRTAAGSAVELMPAPGDHTSHTVLSFEVDDIVREIADLEGRGVRFEDYDTPQLKTEGHIASAGSEKAAWFKDSEGNFLCLHETHLS